MITKGTWYYEVQILMFVFMWLHDTNHKTTNCKCGFRWGRIHIWYDTAWRTHTPSYRKLRRFQKFVKRIIPTLRFRLFALRKRLYWGSIQWINNARVFVASYKQQLDFGFFLARTAYPGDRITLGILWRMHKMAYCHTVDYIKTLE